MFFRNEPQTERRVALVIGIADYDFAGFLNNTLNDSAAIRKELADLGFEMFGGDDLNYQKMCEVIRSFLSSINGADVGLLYYSGHAIQLASENFLVPTDGDISSSDPLEKLISLQEIMTKISKKCRNQPVFSRCVSEQSVSGFTLEPSRRY